jgi:hypothetical protein
MHGTVLALGFTLLAILGQEVAAQNSVIIEYGEVRIEKENEDILCAETQDGESLKILTF